MVKDESIKSKNAQYDILTSDKIYEASHFKDLKTFYSTHNNGKELKEKALQSMGFYDENNMLANGAVLFQERQRLNVPYFQDLIKAVRR